MKVYIAILEPRGEYEDFEGNDYEIIGVYDSEDKAKEAIILDMKRWHYSCHISKENYDIDCREVI